VEIDAWLRGGGLVVTASERAARSIAAAFNRSRRAEGLTAWPASNIQDWQTFARNAWSERGSDGRVVLNGLQEQALWAGIVAAASPQAAQLAGARDRLADLAMEAHGLICAYAPQLLNQKARSAWDQDAAAFSAWLVDFDETCRAANLLSAARLPLELIPTLEADSSTRPPLLLAGFDRILRTQQALFAAWGDYAEVPLGDAASRIEFHQAADPSSELVACALWCKRQLAANPKARLLVITQDVSKRRGEMERAFLRFARTEGSAAGPSSLFEFSLGVPLSQVTTARGAGLLLRWLDRPIDEHEVDWLLSTGQAAARREESSALIAYVRALRRRNLQRTRWTLADFLRQKPGAELPAAWVARMTHAQRRLQEFARRPQSPLAWAEFTPQMLDEAGWPGARPLASTEFQAVRRWRQTVDDCASLGFDGRRIEWQEFLAALDHAVNETLFAPESQDAAILIAGPAESAGLTADAIWFLGANEEAWPAGGATHPLLPLAVKREAGMPHASPKLDWELATVMTRRLLASAPEVHFSFSRQNDGVDARPSRLVAQLADAPQPLSAELAALEIPAPLTVSFDDASQIPFPPGDAPGGASVLTAQSQCPFKAFATARLGAQDWEPAEAGLTAQERGQLLHAVLHSIWAGPPDGIRTHAELANIQDRLSAFVKDHVRRGLQAKMPSRARECMPSKYLELEEARLVELVTEWLRYESSRVPFTVLETEQKATASIAELTLHLRLDRIDRLIDDTLLVIDYKSGNVSPSSWDLPRPDDVQLPLYAEFALDCETERLGGLVFAKVRTGESNREFAGCVRDAKTTLFPGLTGNSGLMRRKLTGEDMAAWRACIEQLARNFLAGQAEVDPRDYPKTCVRCGLQALCRIEENPPQPEDTNSGDGEEADNA
jgi:probable DNA repair protein